MNHFEHVIARTQAQAELARLRGERMAEIARRMRVLASMTRNGKLTDGQQNEWNELERRSRDAS